MTQTSHTLVARPLYDAVLHETLSDPSIKVLIGLRRCGKSTLLMMLKDNLLHNGIPEQNILYLKLDSYDVPLEPTDAWLDELLASKAEETSDSHPFYVFLDEIQEVKGWERPIRRLYESGKARIYLTGSNASLLSSDLATYLSGRYIEIPVYPLSLSEYQTFAEAFRQPQSNEQFPEGLFDTFLRFGGMPGLFVASNFEEASVERTLSAIHDTVLLNDVAKRFGIRDIDLLEKLVRYVYTTAGNLFSANKVAGALTSMGRKTNPETIDNYLSALKRACALHACEQTGLRGKEVLSPQRKYYAPDTGLGNLESGFRMQNIGFQLENVVFLELLRRGYTIYVGSLPSGEIDFVAERMAERVYIQVCELMLDEATRRREEAPLNAIGDSYPKLILTRDQTAAGVTQTGIRIVPIVDWLVEQ